MIRTNKSNIHYQCAREHLFNYNIELCGIRNQYVRSSLKIEQDQLRNRLNQLLEKMNRDVSLLEVGVNVEEMFTCLETKDFVSNLSKAYELMVLSWEKLSVCDE